MAKRRRKVALLNVRGEFLSIAAAHCADEIPKVVSRFWSGKIDFYQRLALVFSFGKKLPMFNDSFFKIQFVCNFPGILLRDSGNGFVFDQAARFKEQEGATEIEHGHELVWRLALVFEVRLINITSAEAHHTCRERAANSPAGDIQ